MKIPKAIKIIIAIILVLIIAGILVLNYIYKNENNKTNEVEKNTTNLVQKNNSNGEIQTIEQNGETIKYKLFKPSFKKSQESTVDDYDFSQDMEYKDKIYHKKINSYSEYQEYKKIQEDILDMTEEDFSKYFMIVTAVENTDMLGLTVDKIENYEEGLYISLIKSPEEESIDSEKTCISYVIPRTMERTDIYCTRNLKEEEKDLSNEMQIANLDNETDSQMLNYQYKTEDYRELEKESNSPNATFTSSEQEWKDVINEDFVVTKDMPDINFENWKNIGDDFYILEIKEHSEYLKLMNTYNLKELSWYDFKYVYPTIIIRTNSDYTIDVGNIQKDETGKEYIPVSIGGILDVSENFKYPGIITILPNYRSLEENYIDIKLETRGEENDKIIN